MTRTLFAVLFVAAASIFAGCGSDPAGNLSNLKPANSNTANSAGANNASNDPTAVTTPTPDQVTNNAPTLTPVYKAYCAAVVKKDDAALRKVWTADSIKFFEDEMKAEGIKSLHELMDKVTNEVCEVSNERFKGDKAVGKVKNVSYPNGFDVLFVKENGEWKMSNIAPEKGFN